VVLRPRACAERGAACPQGTLSGTGRELAPRSAARGSSLAAVRSLEGRLPPKTAERNIQQHARLPGPPRRFVARDAVARRQRSSPRGVDLGSLSPTS